MELNKAYTPKSERSRASYGSLLMGVGGVPGLCSSRKCVKREGHGGSCWPATEEG